MITALIILGGLCGLFWWSVIGAVVLACLQDTHGAADDRDPLIADLPLWQIALCGPIAWAIRLSEELRT